jgi:Fic family protein
MGVEEHATHLKAGIPEQTLATLRELVRQMNSYYSNLIEGQGTHPLNIERALHNDYSHDAAIARLQRLAVAHIDAERELETQIPIGEALLSATACRAHQALYARLPPEDQRTDDGHTIRPGELRQADVEVGDHVPPAWQSLPRFLEAFDREYGRTWQPGYRLIAVACAHQRLAWVHPFLDGNGRAIRLQTQLALIPTSAGLWSANRGFARNKASYYARLSSADLIRQGDLDGRGNLTERGLLSWVDFFLDVCADQIRFLDQCLNLRGIRRGIEGLIAFESAQPSTGLRPQAVLPLHHLFLAGEMTRGEFAQATGLGERTARELIGALLRYGLVTSPGRYAPLHFGFPLRSLHFLLPGLYPEAAQP